MIVDLSEHRSWESLRLPRVQQWARKMTIALGDPKNSGFLKVHDHCRKQQPAFLCHQHRFVTAICYWKTLIAGQKWISAKAIAGLVGCCPVMDCNIYGYVSYKHVLKIIGNITTCLAVKPTIDFFAIITTFRKLKISFGDWNHHRRGVIFTFLPKVNIITSRPRA